MGIEYQYYPKSRAIPQFLTETVDVFDDAEAMITSSSLHLTSNQVLAKAAPGLIALGYEVETGKLATEKIQVPVLFGRNASHEKWFDADAVHWGHKVAVEVEAGRGVTNNDFLKHLFQACMMHDIHYFVSVVRVDYRGAKNFEQVYKFFDTLYASRRLALPLDGVLIVGY